MRQASIALLAATALAGAACHTIRPVTSNQLSGVRPKFVWVTRTDQSVVVVETPRMFGDTLVGYINGEFQELPGADLKGMRYRRLAGARTAGLVAASVLGTATMVALVSSSGKFHDPIINLDCDDDPDQPGCPGAAP